MKPGAQAAACGLAKTAGVLLQASGDRYTMGGFRGSLCFSHSL